MTENANQWVEPLRADNDVPQERACLRCREPFPSAGFGERICRRCKSRVAWRNGVSLSRAV